MRINVCRTLLLSLLVILTTLVTPLYSQTTSAGKFVEITVHAKTLEKNLLGESPDRKVEIYLPSSYNSQPSARFPVLYHLHGYSLHSVLGDWVSVFQESLDKFVDKNPSRQMIVVIPDGFTTVGGSFWLNSPMEGQWKDFIASELPHYIDAHYRTIDNRDSRGVSGHSMGGFAALRMAELHSDVFSVAYAFSPCCTDFIADMTSHNPAWRQVLQFRSPADIRHTIAANQFWPAALAAFALAASPDPQSSVKAEFPYALRNGGLESIPKTVERWRRVMPDPLVTKHVTNLRSLRGIGLDYGMQDEFTHIPTGVNDFTQLLEKNAIPFFFESYPGDHNSGVPIRVLTRLLPFMAERLVFENRK